MKDKSVLIVEDDPTLARFWGRLLSDLHCRHYHVASKPSDALDWMKKYGSDIMVADINLPEFSGIQLVEKAKKLNRRLKTILTSTTFDPHGSRPKGFVHFLKKPYQKLDKVYRFMGQVIEDDDFLSELEKKGKVHIWDL